MQCYHYAVGGFRFWVVSQIFIAVFRFLFQSRSFEHGPSVSGFHVCYTEYLLSLLVNYIEADSGTRLLFAVSESSRKWSVFLPTTLASILLLVNLINHFQGVFKSTYHRGNNLMLSTALIYCSPCFMIRSNRNCRCLFAFFKFFLHEK